MLPFVDGDVGADLDKLTTSSEGLVIFVRTDTREERLARRIADLYATDQQFADQLSVTVEAVETLQQG